MIPVFFATNYHNYGRWMTFYVLELLNIDTSHPGLRPTLENGSFSVRQTKSSSARSPVELTLEQTVNKDAASRQTGISSFTQSESARRRWMITRSMRSQIFGEVMNQVGL